LKKLAATHSTELRQCFQKHVTESGDKRLTKQLVLKFDSKVFKKVCVYFEEVLQTQRQGATLKWMHHWDITNNFIWSREARILVSDLWLIW